MMTLALSDFGQFIIFIALLIVGGFWLVLKLSDRAGRRKIDRLEAELDYYRNRKE